MGRYLNKDFVITLPEKKKITDITWFSVYDLTTQNTFGDVDIPQGFEPPQPQKIGQFSKRGDHRVDSESITIIDSKTIRISGFKFDGRGADTFFWVGLGPQPSAKGFKVPDEHG